MKKAISVLLCLILIFPLTLTLAFAAASPEISLSTAEAAVGSEAQLVLSIKNNPGIAYLKVKLELPKGITLKAKPVNSGALTGTYTVSKTLDTNPYVIQWMGAENSSANGTLATLTLAVGEGVAIGENQITVSVSECYNQDFETINVGVSAGKIKVSCSHSFTNYLSDNNATCMKNGTKTALCDNGCGAKDVIEEANSKLFHSFGDYTSDNNATHFADGTKTATCKNGCGTTDTITDVGTKIPHSFTLEVRSAEAVKTVPSCVSDAEYFYSCSCGALSDSQGFTVEDTKLGHDFVRDTKRDVAATTTATGIEAYSCSRCDATDDKATEMLKEIEVEETAKLKKLEGKFIAIASDLTKAEFIKLLPSGVVLSEDKGEDVLYTGMTVALKDENFNPIDTLTVIVMGDVDGNGKVQAADARLALRQSVGLENLDEIHVKAALVAGATKLAAAQARLILRASVGLETAESLLAQ